VTEIAASSGALDNFDIVFTETLVGVNPNELRELKKHFSALQPSNKFVVFHITFIYKSCTTSYLIGPKKLERVLASLKRGLDTNISLDLYIKQQEISGELKLGCIFPFISTVPLEFHTTLGGTNNRALQKTLQANNILRHSFFVHRDLDACAAAIANLSRPTDRHGEIIEGVLGLIVSFGVHF
jgi:hypothetical protein